MLGFYFKQLRQSAMVYTRADFEYTCQCESSAETTEIDSHVGCLKAVMSLQHTRDEPLLASKFKWTSQPSVS